MSIKNLYAHKNIPKAKSLRKNSTPAEYKLWKHIKNSQLNIKFKRQQCLLNYIVDFYCMELKLAIEIDGSSHDEIKYEYDRQKEENLKTYNITILRFTEYEVIKNVDSVLQTIVLHITVQPPLTPLHLLEGGKKGDT